MPMTTPTAAAVRTWSQAPFATWGYPAPAGGGDDRLDRIVAAATAWIVDVTGWETVEAVPDAKVPLVELAIRLATEMFAAQTTPDYLETLADFDLIQAFSAGSYSETRRSPEDAVKAKMLAAWPPLHAAILAAMTDDARDEYLAYLDGKNAPAFSVTEVDWSGVGGSYDLWGWDDPMYAWTKVW